MVGPVNWPPPADPAALAALAARMAPQSREVQWKTPRSAGRRSGRAAADALRALGAVATVVPAADGDSPGLTQAFAQSPTSPHAMEERCSSAGPRARLPRAAAASCCATGNCPRCDDYDLYVHSWLIAPRSQCGWRLKPRLRVALPRNREARLRGLPIPICAGEMPYRIALWPGASLHGSAPYVVSHHIRAETGHHRFIIHARMRRARAIPRMARQSGSRRSQHN